jgi:hypothetical protein
MTEQRPMPPGPPPYPSAPPPGGYPSPPLPGGYLPPAPGGYPPYGPPPPPRKTRTGLIVTLVVVGVAVLGLVIAGVVAGLQPSADRNEAGEITSGGDVSAFDIQVGDCFDLPNPNGEVTDVGGVPCTDPHDAEVYGTFDIDGTDYPGTDRVTQLADRGCKQRFADFVGLAYRKSELEMQYLYPTERSWDAQDDREVVCSVTEPKGKTTVETLENAER